MPAALCASRAAARHTHLPAGASPRPDPIRAAGQQNSLYGGRELAMPTAADYALEDTLAATARWTAATRGRESARPDRLFTDPWAALLAGDEGNAWLERFSAGQSGSGDFLTIRTRFFDD